MNQPDLSHNHYQGDHANPHIILADAQERTMLMRLVIACPAGLYKMDDKGTLHFDYAGCLECGTCRVLCGKTILEKWEYPVGTMGVEYRHG